MQFKPIVYAGLLAALNVSALPVNSQSKVGIGHGNYY